MNGLRLPYHRGTTAHVASLFPFALQRPARTEGVYVGLDALAGGAEFCWDPFDAYAAGRIANPNAWVFGEPGYRKSTLVKSLLWRMAAVHGPERWFAVVDPKGEYRPLADALGMTVVRLAPGAGARLNPLAAGPGAPADGREDRVGRGAAMTGALAATVLGRPLSPGEDAAVFAAVADAHAERPRGDPTLAEVTARLFTPTPAMTRRLRDTADGAAETARPAAFALDKLLSRDLRGLFDGDGTVPLAADGPGVVLDLSGVYADAAALPVVMVAATGWLAELMVTPGPRRVQVLDEAWALLASRPTAAWVQACFKLGRAYGVANLCVAHRPSDLAAQSDDGTATAKIAAGLVADAATTIILRQAPDQVPLAATAFGLTTREAELIGALARGRALWRVGGRVHVVHHHLGPDERPLCDTDARMTGPTHPGEAPPAAGEPPGNLHPFSRRPAA